MSREPTECCIILAKGSKSFKDMGMVAVPKVSLESRKMKA